MLSSIRNGITRRYPIEHTNQSITSIHSFGNAPWDHPALFPGICIPLRDMRHCTRQICINFMTINHRHINYYTVREAGLVPELNEASCGLPSPPGHRHGEFHVDTMKSYSRVFDVLPALKGEDSSVGSFETASPFRDLGDRRSPEPRRGDPNNPRLSACGFVDAPSALRAGCGGLGIRSEWPAPPDSGAWPPRPSRVVGHGPRHRPSRPSKPHGRDQPGEDCFLAAAAMPSRRPRRRPLGNGMIAFVVRAEPNPIASFCPCRVAYRPTPGGISVGRAERAVFT